MDVHGKSSARGANHVGCPLGKGATRSWETEAREPGVAPRAVDMPEGAAIGGRDRSVDPPFRGPPFQVASRPTAVLSQVAAPPQRSLARIDTRLLEPFVRGLELAPVRPVGVRAVEAERHQGPRGARVTDVPTAVSRCRSSRRITRVAMAGVSALLELTVVRTSHHRQAPLSPVERASLRRVRAALVDEPRSPRHAETASPGARPRRPRRDTGPASDRPSRFQLTALAESASRQGRGGH